MSLWSLLGLLFRWLVGGEASSNTGTKAPLDTLANLLCLFKLACSLKGDRIPKGDFSTNVDFARFHVAPQGSETQAAPSNEFHQISFEGGV